MQLVDEGHGRWPTGNTAATAPGRPAVGPQFERADAADVTSDGVFHLASRVLPARGFLQISLKMAIILWDFGWGVDLSQCMLGHCVVSYCGM
mmetsp:Transcript_55448/g.121470  ORF Transcript_55448/g.121470 Transcript_55448/m.121470 type:complete len:92 (+) Transcript_55448:328-603(+)